ncbi:MAG: RluA family pseudouridine synthase [Actinobacteria bacterium]|nr:RluA family pseudouridine synthase [Actinomycetota bacterium]NBQ59540.1 RluA family pseudouridine synthase [Actinomycetota bacterium]NBY82465.1 RluA family pseudouridine synthase [Actinomycetota bacterium]NCU78109.1 RluA family pseudouridine synthase [Actinomycetota bacterium]NCZ76750.1 RluA family pseudouridine synthase [Actinomycetota bacterium]
MSNRERKSLSIPEGLNLERVDTALSRLLGLSRNVVVGLIESGEILKSGTVVGKSDRVISGDVIEILMPEVKGESKLVATPIEGLKVVYDDEYLIVIDKPVGIAAHPSPGWHGATVVGAIFAAGYQLATSGAAERQGVVHRLDVGTSGLMVVAKNEIAYASLKDQFRQRTVSKVYHALVQGHMDPTVGTIDAPIDRHPREDYRFAVVANGKPSITHYKTLEVFPAVTLLEIELETGRTHQIRVHFSALHHPLVGDQTYGSDPALAQRLKISRPWLHARKLAFTHPASGERIFFTSEYPEDLTRSLELLSDLSR